MCSYYGRSDETIYPDDEVGLIYEDEQDDEDLSAGAYANGPYGGCDLTEDEDEPLDDDIPF